MLPITKLCYPCLLLLLLEYEYWANTGSDRRGALGVCVRGGQGVYTQVP